MSQEQIPSNWWNEFLKAIFGHRFILKLKPESQTLKEFEFVKKVAPREGSLTILDMPCGIGRHAIELASEGVTSTSFRGCSHDHSVCQT